MHEMIRHVAENDDIWHVLTTEPYHVLQRSINIIYTTLDW